MSRANYYFFLGNTPALSRLEIESMLGESLLMATPTIGQAEVELDAPAFGTKLGGTRKIGILLKTCSKEDLFVSLGQIIVDTEHGKNIAVTDYIGLGLTSSDLFALKSSVQKIRPIRLVSTEVTEHEGIMLIRQHVSEYNLVSAGGGMIDIVLTVWLQDGLTWAKKDRSRPYQDIKRGMLPPKVARIMVNLATRGKSGTLLDPFCGTGTILMEAMQLGLNVVGGDTDPKGIEGTEQNLSWMISSYNLKANTQNLKVSDATHIDDHIQSVDYIVTEPYMGPLLDNRKSLEMGKVQDIAKGLDKLYRGCLRTWSHLLSPGGRIVMIFPEFIVGSRVVKTTSVDTITGLGYNISSQVPYSKPGAVVIRNITTLTKINN